MRTSEIRSAYGWYGYAKAQSDFDEFAKDRAFSTSTGSEAFEGWKVVKKFHCYSADRSPKAVSLPDCDPDTPRSFESVQRISIRELSEGEARRFIIEGYVGSLIA